MLQRMPLGSARPTLAFAYARLGLTLATAVALAVFDFDDHWAALVVVLAAGLPWSLLMLGAALRDPDAALYPVTIVGDFALLVLLEAVAPLLYGPVRFLAVFLIAAHAHLQGERRGIAFAVVGSLALVVPSSIRGDGPVAGARLAAYETIFVLVCLATGIVIGRLRTTESASRVRARDLSRRTMQSESEVRRRLADSLHDGPVQELIGLDMVLSAARSAAAVGDGERASELIDEARALTMRNVEALRNEILDLGPYAFHELSYAAAIEKCLPLWQKRYGFDVLVTIDPVELPPELAGELFRITQEAVVNAGRHSGAEAVSLNLRTVDSQLELRVTDNGSGIPGDEPLGATEPGHIGLAGMRERAEMLDGTLELETSERGTKVLVRAPLPRP